MQKAALVAHEAIIPGTGSILYDRAEVSGIVKSFNKAEIEGKSMKKGIKGWKSGGHRVFRSLKRVSRVAGREHGLP